MQTHARRLGKLYACGSRERLITHKLLKQEPENTATCPAAFPFLLFLWPFWRPLVRSIFSSHPPQLHLITTSSPPLVHLPLGIPCFVLALYYTAVLCFIPVYQDKLIRVGKQKSRIKACCNSFIPGFVKQNVYISTRFCIIYRTTSLLYTAK